MARGLLEQSGMQPSFAARTRMFKYAVKRTVIRLWPDAWWSSRRLVQGLPEPELALIPLLCCRSTSFVDVGANFGFYTWFASRYAATVHAIEPLPWVAAMLRSGFRNRNVEVHECALSDQSGSVELRSPRGNIGFSTIEPSNELEGKADLSAGVARIQVETRRLDDIPTGRVSCLKIDAEGHEQEVLRGAWETLERCRPAVIIEVEERHRAGSVALVNDLLATLDYQRWWMRGGALEQVANSAVIDATEDARNFVFLPADKAQAIARG